MSTILKALRQLEDDREDAREASAGQLLHAGSSQRTTRSGGRRWLPRLLAASGALLLVAGLVDAWISGAAIPATAPARGAVSAPPLPAAPAAPAAVLAPAAEAAPEPLEEWVEPRPEPQPESAIAADTPAVLPTIGALADEPRRVLREPMPDVVVTGTIWHPTRDRRVAVIEEPGAEVPLRLGEGEFVGSLQVVEITPSGVVFGRDGVEIMRRVGSPR